MRCSDPKRCAQRARLGPPDNDCSYSINISKLLNDSETNLNEDKNQTTTQRNIQESQQNANYTECEYADDAINLEKKDVSDCISSCSFNRTVFNEAAKNPYITVNGKEELPCVHEIKYYLSENMTQIEKISESEILGNQIINNRDRNKIRKNINGNYNQVNVKNIYSYCTLPKNKKKVTCPKYWLRHANPPKRVTPDGTHIYYWCDIHKKNYGKCHGSVSMIYNGHYILILFFILEL